MPIAQQRYHPVDLGEATRLAEQHLEAGCRVRYCTMAWSASLCPGPAWSLNHFGRIGDEGHTAGLERTTEGAVGRSDAIGIVMEGHEQQEMASK